MGQHPVSAKLIVLFLGDLVALLPSPHPEFYLSVRFRSHFERIEEFYIEQLLVPVGPVGTQMVSGNTAEGPWHSGEAPESGLVSPLDVGAASWVWRVFPPRWSPHFATARITSYPTPGDQGADGSFGH